GRGRRRVVCAKLVHPDDVPCPFFDCHYQPRPTGAHNGGVEGGGADAVLVAALRAGDEGAFRALVTRHHAAMVRVARFYVPTRAIAEEVVQDTWLAVVEGIDRFEGRSSLKTWIFRILSNRARTR